MLMVVQELAKAWQERSFGLNNYSELAVEQTSYVFCVVVANDWF